MLNETNIIPKDKLKKWGWYMGPGRGSNIAIWDGQAFQFITQLESGVGINTCSHYDDGGCFAPIEHLHDSLYPTVGAFARLIERQKERDKKG